MPRLLVVKLSPPLRGRDNIRKPLSFQTSNCLRDGRSHCRIRGPTLLHDGPDAIRQPKRDSFDWVVRTSARRDDANNFPVGACIRERHFPSENLDNAQSSTTPAIAPHPMTYLPHDHCKCVYVSLARWHGTAESKLLRIQNLWRRPAQRGREVAYLCDGVQGVAVIHHCREPEVREAGTAMFVNKDVDLKMNVNSVEAILL